MSNHKESKKRKNQLIGDAIIKLQEQGGISNEELKAILDVHIKKPKDRTLIGLKPQKNKNPIKKNPKIKIPCPIKKEEWQLIWA